MHRLETGETLKRQPIRREILFRGLQVEYGSPGERFLERHLGIIFTEQVGYAEFNLRNRLILALAEPDYIPRPRGYFLLGIKRDKVEPPAFYDPVHNICFTWGDDQRKMSYEYLHEILHGYTMQQSPRLLRQYLQDDETLDGILRDEVDPTQFPELMERRISTRFLMEGIAQWGSIEALRRGIDDLDKKVDLDEIMREKCFDAYKRTHSQEQALQTVRTLSMEDYKEVLQLKGLKKREAQIQKGDDVLKFFYYSQSMRFTREVIVYMESKGVSTANSINLLIGNMPNRLDQVANAVQFAEAVLLAG